MNFESVIAAKDLRIHALECQLGQFENQLNSYRSELTLYQKRCQQYSQAYDSLRYQIKELQRYRFGKRSERYIEDPENPQVSFLDPQSTTCFATADAVGAALPHDGEASITRNNKEQPNVESDVDAIKQKRKKKKPIPVRIEIIPVPNDQKQCACGNCKSVIRYEIKQLLHHQQAIFEIVEQRREVVACTHGCESEIVTAPSPIQVLPKIKATEEFLSFLAVSKLDDRQPLYHLEKQLSERFGIDCSRQTMARWLIELVAPLQVMYNLFKDNVISYDITSCDATGLQVLNEPGRKPETKSYVYCIRGGPPDQSVILYDYNALDHKAFVQNWFTGFEGYLHVDGDNFFESMGNGVHRVNCNAHARRKFEPLAQGSKGSGIAKQAMHYFKELYQIEREAKDKDMTPEERHALRQKESKPLTEQFKVWLDQIYPTTLPQSPLGKALKYCLNLWPGLIKFLDDGRLEIDNNLTEQAIKPLVIARKNFLFSATINGASALCMHLTIIRTAKLHKQDPYQYYVKLLKALPRCKTLEDYERLLPWNVEKQDSQNPMLNYQPSTPNIKGALNT